MTVVCVKVRSKLYCCFVDFRTFVVLQIPDSWYWRKFWKNYKSNLSESTCVRQDKRGLSEHYMLNTGVKQDCTMSPTLFNTFISDLPDIFEDCYPVLLGERSLNCLMYADNTVILSQTRSGLQKALNRWQEYYGYCEWSLSVNEDKTKAMIFMSLDEF